MRRDSRSGMELAECDLAEDVVGQAPFGVRLLKRLLPIGRSRLEAPLERPVRQQVRMCDVSVGLVPFEEASKEARAGPDVIRENLRSGAAVALGELPWRAGRSSLGIGIATGTVWDDLAGTRTEQAAKLVGLFGAATGVVLLAMIPAALAIVVIPGRGSSLFAGVAAFSLGTLLFGSSAFSIRLAVRAAIAAALVGGASVWCGSAILFPTSSDPQHVARALAYVSVGVSTGGAYAILARTFRGIERRIEPDEQRVSSRNRASLIGIGTVGALSFVGLIYGWSQLTPEGKPNAQIATTFGLVGFAQIFISGLHLATHHGVAALKTDFARVSWFPAATWLPLGTAAVAVAEAWSGPARQLVLNGFLGGVSAAAIVNLSFASIHWGLHVFAGVPRAAAVGYASVCSVAVLLTSLVFVGHTDPALKWLSVPAFAAGLGLVLCWEKRPVSEGSEHETPPGIPNERGEK